MLQATSRKATFLSRLIVFAACCYALGASAEIKEWQNQEGNRMSAELIGYDLKEKKVQFGISVSVSGCSRCGRFYVVSNFCT